MVYWRKLKDGSFAVINDFIDLKDEENQTIMIRLLNDKFGVKHQYHSLECNHQYHFTRDEMVKIFEEIFPLNSQAWDWDCVWYCDFGDTNSFHAFKDDDEYYILHKPSGTMINWYKHVGRCNTCNKDLSLEELKLFLLLLRKELVEEEIVRPKK